MKYFYGIILSLIFFPLQIIGQSLIEMDKLISEKNSEINIATNKLKELELKYPKFIITGEIRDRTKDLSIINIWGTAFPFNHDFNEYGTQLNAGNIIVLNADQNKVNYNLYLEGIHYFIEKKYGKNVMGTADVPIYVYGDIPNIYDKNRMKSLKEEIQTGEEQLAYLIQQNKQLKIEKLIDEADKLFAEKYYEESISKFKEIIGLNKDYTYKYNTKIAESYGIIADNYFNSKEYEKAITNYTNALSYDSNQRYLIRKAESYQNIGDEKLKAKLFSDAIVNYEIVIAIYPNVAEKIKPFLAEAYFNLGKNCYTNGQSIDASIYFKKSYSLDNNLKNDIVPIFSSMRRPPILYAFYSIIPGLGQILQGKNSKGMIHFSIFSASVIWSILQNNSSKNRYIDYEKANTVEDAKTLYTQANNLKRDSYLAIGVAVGTLVWSMIDSFNEAKDFNEPFYLTYNYNSNLNSHYLSISLNIR